MMFVVPVVGMSTNATNEEETLDFTFIKVERQNSWLNLTCWRCFPLREHLSGRAERLMICKTSRLSLSLSFELIKTSSRSAHLCQPSYLARCELDLSVVSATRDL